MRRIDTLSRLPSMPCKPARISGGSAIDNHLPDPSDRHQCPGIMIARDNREPIVPFRQHDFEAFLLDDTVIAAATRHVHKLLRDVVAWPGFMPNVSAVGLTHDNGQYQEFTMRLEDGSGAPPTVRVVQRYSSGHIAFFLPDPPGWLKHLCGDWFIRPLTQDTTHLTLVQYWTRRLKAGARTTTHPGAMGTYGHRALEALKRSLEGLAP